MADETTDEMTGIPAFDDDRLLALALGLDDDPQLVAAAAADEGLRRRLDAVRAEVEQVAVQVRAAAPDPGEGYTDLRDPRWAGLQAFFAVPAPAKTRGRASRWLRVLAPAAVALVAVAVGLAVINGQRSGGFAVNSSMPAAASKGAGGEDLLLQPSSTTSAEGAAQAAGFADQVDEFALVVLARAKAASGVFQRFAIVRFLKGDGPDVVRLRVADRPADVGRLHMLFLHPEPEPSATAAPNPLPGATAAAASVDTYGAGLPVACSYQGEPAILREMPAGTDATAVELP